MNNKVSAQDEDGLGDTKELSPVQKRNHTIFKLVKHTCIVAVWFTMGLSAGVLGPTLPDLAKGLNVNFEEIARALSTKSIGLLVGSVSGGFLHEVFYKHTELIMSVGILIGALGTVLVPLARSLSLLSFLLALTGVSEGIINTGGNTLVLHLWGENAAAPMHSVHLFFGIGSLIAPQIARPFLVDSPQIDTMTTISPSNYTNITSLPTVTPPTSRLDLPYGIIAGFGFFMCLIVLVLYFKSPPKGFPKRIQAPLKIKSLISPGSCSGGRIGYGTSMFIFLFMYFLHAAGGENAYGIYISSYSQKSLLKFNKAQSSNLATVFWGFHVLGRFSGIILSPLVRTSFIILGNIILLIITSILLATFGFNQPIAIWVLSGALGYGISFLFPCGMAWANLYLDMNSVGIMILLMGASIGALIYQYVPGYLIQNNGTRSLMWVMVTYSGLIAVTFAILILIAKVWGQPKADTEQTGTSDDKAEKVIVQENKF